jgi:hypothetical protein
LLPTISVALEVFAGAARDESRLGRTTMRRIERLRVPTKETTQLRAYHFRLLRDWWFSAKTTFDDRVSVQ